MVSPERGTYICFGCGEKGDVFYFVQKMEGIDFSAALQQLAEKAGVTLQRRNKKSPEQKSKEERLREVCDAATLFFEAERAKRKDVSNYSTARGVKAETALSWRLGYAPPAWEALSQHLCSVGYSKDEVVEAGLAVFSQKKPGEIFDRFRGRVMFPIFDVGGRVIAFSGRFFEPVVGGRQGEEPAKYINSPETAIFKKSRTLYGLDRARGAIRKADCTLLVEGQFDLLMSHQSGLSFSVALSGTALTQEHLSLIGRLSKRLVLALDADAAGVRSGLRSAHLAILSGFDVKIPSFPQGRDPADLARENPELLKAAIRTSHSAVEFFLNTLQFSARDDRGYKKVVELQVLPLIAAMESKIDQEHFIAIVARALGIPEAAVRSEVAKCVFHSPHPPMDSSKIQAAGGESSLTPLERKIGMLLFYFTEGSPPQQRLEALLGATVLQGHREKLASLAEELRFRFEREVGEHTDEMTVAADLLSDVERMVERERLKTQFL
jgi:DNA primase